MPRTTGLRWQITTGFVGINVALAVHPAHAGYVQEPDPIGWAIPSYSKPLTLHDDWVSPFTGEITGVRFWVAWQGDHEDEVAYDVLMWISADQDLGGMHVPGDSLGQLTTWTGAGTGPPTVDQGWFSPAQETIPEVVILHDHTRLHTTGSILFDPPVVQQGVTYWVSMYVWTTNSVLGWSTSTSHAGMPATYYDPFDFEWKQLMDPLTGAPLDLAFEILPEPPAVLVGLLGLLAATGDRGWLARRRLLPRNSDSMRQT